MNGSEQRIREQYVQTVKLVPHRWTPLPGTGVVVWWDGDQEITVARQGGFWNLAPLAVPGRVLAWVRLADRPVVAIASRSIYIARGGGRMGAPSWAVSRDEPGRRGDPLWQRQRRQGGETCRRRERRRERA